MEAETNINGSLYKRILAIDSYAEFVLKCSIYGIFLPPSFTEEKFTWYFTDDWRWHVLAESIAGGFTIPF